MLRAPRRASRRLDPDRRFSYDGPKVIGKLSINRHPIPERTLRLVPHCLAVAFIRADVQEAAADRTAIVGALRAGHAEVQPGFDFRFTCDLGASCLVLGNRLGIVPGHLGQRR